jgi:hypothetical protein
MDERLDNPGAAYNKSFDVFQVYFRVRITVFVIRPCPPHTRSCWCSLSSLSCWDVHSYLSQRVLNKCMYIQYWTSCNLTRSTQLNSNQSYVDLDSLLSSVDGDIFGSGASTHR